MDEIQIKLLTGSYLTIKLETCGDLTIRELKEKIQAQHPSYPIEQQRIIFGQREVSDKEFFFKDLRALINGPFILIMSEPKNDNKNQSKNVSEYRDHFFFDLQPSELSSFITGTENCRNDFWSGASPAHLWRQCLPADIKRQIKLELDKKNSPMKQISTIAMILKDFYKHNLFFREDLSTIEPSDYLFFPYKKLPLKVRGGLSVVAHSRYDSKEIKPMLEKMSNLEDYWNAHLERDYKKNLLESIRPEDWNAHLETIKSDAEPELRRPYL